ncbi:maleate cis-trans isomerase family protein [Arenibacterium sp. CAU 1754]
MSPLRYELEAEEPPRLGLIVLQSDERIERDFRQLIPDSAAVFVSRVPSGAEVTSETLAAMEAHLPASAALLPAGAAFDAIGYGCTSGTAQIGAARVGDLVASAAQTRTVTDPLSALVAACGALGITRLGFLSPYVETVSSRLRGALVERGVETPVFGSFDEENEARVARITPQSLAAAARQMAQAGGIEGLFLSCTNLNTLDIIAPLSDALNMPVLSSNQVLAWHMGQLSGVTFRDHPALRGLPGGGQG